MSHLLPQIPETPDPVIQDDEEIEAVPQVKVDDELGLTHTTSRQFVDENEVFPEKNVRQGKKPQPVAQPVAPTARQKRSISDKQRAHLAKAREIAKAKRDARKKAEQATVPGSTAAAPRGKYVTEDDMAMFGQALIEEYESNRQKQKAIKKKTKQVSKPPVDYAQLQQRDDETYEFWKRYF